MKSWLDITWAVHGSKLEKIDKNIPCCLPALRLLNFFSNVHTLFMNLYTVNRSIPPGDRHWLLLFNTTLLFSVSIGIQCIGPKPMIHCCAERF